MKKYLWLILVFAFVGMNAQNLDSLIDVSGWEDFDGYKKQKLIIGDITYRQISKDKTKLFTADSNKYFKLWDLETGKLIKSINIEHQLPVFLLNDTLILFRASTKNPNYQKNVYGYSLNDNIEYVYLEHEFYIDSKDKLINYSSFQVLFDSVLVVPLEKSEFSYIYASYILSGKTYSIKTKIEINDYLKLGKNNNGIFNNITCVDDSNYYADYIGYGANYKAGTSGYYFGVKFYDNKNPISISINLNPPNNFRSITSDNNNNKLFVCEANNFYVIDTKLKNTIKNLNLLDTLTSICLLDSNTIVAYNNKQKRIVTYNWQKNIYNYYYMISNNYLNKMVYLKDKSEFIITNNGGEIYLLSDSVFNQKNVTFEMEAKEWLMQKQVKLTNLSALTFDSFYWNFGDGEGSSDVHPYHIFKKEGKYRIELTGVKDGFFSSYTDSIIILPNYYPTFEIDKSYGEAPLKVKFKNTSNFEADSVLWAFGNNPTTLSNVHEGEITISNLENEIIYLTVYKAGKFFKTSKTVRVIKNDTNFFEIKHLESQHRSYYSNADRSSLTINKFYKMIASSENNIVYSYLYKESDYHAGSTKIKEVFHANTYKLNENITIKNTNHKLEHLFSYTDGGIIGVIDNTLVIYDRNIEFLFQFFNENNYRNFQTINNKYILANNKINIAFFDKYFKILKEYSIADFTNEDVDSINNIQLFQSSNKFNSNLNSYVFLQSNSKILTIVEFENFNVKQKFTLIDFELASYNITKHNELCLISKSGELKFIDLNTGTAKNYQNFNYSKFSYYDDNILYEIKYEYFKEPKGLKVNFIDFEGNLIYQYNNRIHLNNSSYEYDLFDNLYISYDNIIYILSHDDYYEMFSLYSLYPQKSFTPSVIYNSENTNSSIYPNPTSDYININNGDIQNIKIYGMTGIEINFKAEFFGNLVRVNITELQTGIYVVRYELQGKIYNEKFVKY